MQIISNLRKGLKFFIQQLEVFISEFTGIIISRPFNVYYLITGRCNANCKCCWFARDTYIKKTDEANVDEIINMLNGLKKFMGSFHINVSGGEPLLRKTCLLKIAKYAKENNIMLGITTNGFLLDNEFCERIMKDGLFFNVNVSVDFLCGTHCKERGIDMHFDEFRKRLEMLSHNKRKYLAETKLIIKTIIRSDNISKLCELVEFTRTVGFDHINFQPIIEQTEYARILKDNISKRILEETFDCLVKYKKVYSGIILNEKRHLNLFYKYFIGKLETEHRRICQIGFNNLYIYPNLDVSFGCFETFGNLRENSINTLWKNNKANEIRKKIRKCEKYCLATCQIERTLVEKIMYGYRILFTK